jgi:hypothetical protein
MISIGNLKLAQLRKLFIRCQYHLIQNFRIFKVREGIHFEFTIFSIVKLLGAHWLASLPEQWRPTAR